MENTRVVDINLMRQQQEAPVTEASPVPDFLKISLMIGISAFATSLANHLAKEVNDAITKLTHIN